MVGNDCEVLRDQGDRETQQPLPRYETVRESVIRRRPLMWSESTLRFCAIRGDRGTQQRLLSRYGIRLRFSLSERYPAQKECACRIASKGTRKVRNGEEHSYVGLAEPEPGGRPQGKLGRKDSASVTVMPLGAGSVTKHSNEVLGHVCASLAGASDSCPVHQVNADDFHYLPRFGHPRCLRQSLNQVWSGYGVQVFPQVCSQCNEPVREL